MFQGSGPRVQGLRLRVKGLRFWAHRFKVIHNSNVPTDSASTARKENKIGKSG